MPRFFTDSPSKDGKLTLTGEDARHIVKALRMQPGEGVTVCNGAGTDYLCEIYETAADTVTVRILESCPSKGEPGITAALLMALPKADKMDFIVQKATELGVTKIIPFLSSRCVSRPDARSLAKKIERWQKIAAEAAKQCGRGRIPAVDAALPFADALYKAAQAQTALFLYETERVHSLRAALTQAPLSAVSIMIGPEGGFAPEEVQAALQAGLVSVSLGPRILRCETAPLAALAALMYESNNL